MCEIHVHSSASMHKELSISKPQMIEQVLSHELWAVHTGFKFTRLQLVSRNVNTQLVQVYM